MNAHSQNRPYLVRKASDRQRSRRALRRRLRAVAPLIVGGSLCYPGLGVAVGLAQVMEQNPAPLIFGDQKTTLGTAPLTLDGDETPIGVPLVSLAVVDTRTTASTSNTPSSGPIDLSRAGPKVQKAALQDHLAPFIGQPLSEALLNRLRAVIVRHYRDLDRPFVAVTVPPQDVSGGRLRMEITEFRVGQVRTEGNTWTPAPHLLDTIGLQPGQDIAATPLIDDLNWLNLNPFRNLSAVFEPGTVPGTTDIILRAQDRRPWMVYAGYANSGSPGTGRHRVFTGFTLANLPLLDHQLSYKFAANPDSLSHGDWIGADQAPGYVSHAASYFAPLSFGAKGRAKLWITAGYAESNAVLDDTWSQSGTSWSITNEVAFPLSWPAVTSADLFVGADVKRQDTTLSFAGTSMLTTHQGVGQVRGGARAVAQYQIGPLDTDLTAEASVVGSPGALVPNSTAYVYGSATLHQVSRLDSGYGLGVTLTGQGTTDTLPSLEKRAFGRTSGLRGYETNELVGNSGIQGSLTLLLPPASWPLLETGLRVSAQPYGFFDGAYVWDDTLENRGARSLGAGLDLSIGSIATATIEAGYTLDDGPRTDGGSASVMGTVVVRY